MIKEQIQEQLKQQAREQMQNEIKRKAKEQMASHQQIYPTPKTVPEYIGNWGKDITTLGMGLVGLVYQPVRHPIKSAKTVGSMAGELVKEMPKATIGLAKQMTKTVISPVKTIKEGVESYKKVRDLPYTEQTKIFKDISEQFIKEESVGKRTLRILGTGMIEAGIKEITHPVEYAYENPLFFALDVLSVGQATGANKLVSSTARKAGAKIPAVVKIEAVLKEAFLPYGKLVATGYDNLAKEFTKVKSEVFKVQKNIIDDTTTKFYKEFKLNAKEQTEFFETIDKLRRVEKPTAAKAVKKVKPLAQEVRKYKSAEEFVKAQGEKTYRSAHQIDLKTSSPITEISDNTLTTFTDEFKRQYGYPSLKSKEVNKLKDIISNPNKDVTIYRASPKNELNSGDWVTINKDYANDIKRQNGGKVYTHTVKAEDLFYPKTLEGFKELPSLNKWGAFQYQASQLKSQLTDFYNQAVKEVKKVKPEIKATSANPKIQQAINWWLDKEAPKLAQQAGLPAEKAIQNYLYHFFPEKFKGKEVAITKPLQFAQKGYLKKSMDVEGFTKDPVLSIAAIKSKVAIDNLKNNFITNTINKYAVKLDDIKQQLVNNGIDITKYTPEGLIEKAKQILNLEEYKPKGTIRFYPVITEAGKKVSAVSKKVETHLMPKVIVDELTKFTIGGKSTLEKMFLPFDIFNRNWKPLATSTRFRYHTRNILGNIYNSTVVAGNNPISFVLKEMPIAGYQQIQSVISKSIKSGSLLGKVYQKFFGNVVEPKIIKLAVDNDVVGRGFFGADINDLITIYNNGDDIMRNIKNIQNTAEIATPVRPAGMVMKNLKGKMVDVDVNVLGHWMRTMTKVGEFLEDNARIALFKQGLKKFKGDVSLSKEYVNKHLFDYLTGLGDIDKVIKRFVPFWSWTRFNVPLQAGSLIKTPLRYAAMQRGTTPYVESIKQTDEGYQYLTEEQQKAGLIKVGTTFKGDKEYDKYVRTASVIPISDLSRMVNILQGREEEIGFTPLFQIYNLIATDPTEFKTYFGQPAETFTGEKKKFLGVGIRGRTKELLSTIPLLTEINKAIGGSYHFKEMPKFWDRVEQVISPLGVQLIDKENSKFFSELEKQKKLTGTYVGGLQSIYKKYIKKGIQNKDEKYIEDNIETIEKILRQKGLTTKDLIKLKNSAIKALFKDALNNK